MKVFIFVGLLVTLFASVALALPHRLRAPSHIKNGIQRQSAASDDFERIVAAYKATYFQIDEICRSSKEKFDAIVVNVDTEIVNELQGRYGGAMMNLYWAAWDAEDDFTPTEDPQVAAYVIDILWNYSVSPILTETTQKVEEIFLNKIPEAYDAARELNQKATKEVLKTVEDLMQVIRPFLPEHYRSK